MPGSQQQRALRHRTGPLTLARCCSPAAAAAACCKLPPLPLSTRSPLTAGPSCSAAAASGADVLAAPPRLKAARQSCCRLLAAAAMLPTRTGRVPLLLHELYYRSEILKLGAIAQ